MTTLTSGAEVFDVAMGMEQIGRDFYEALGLASDSPKVRAFCLAAASDEDHHYAHFRRLRDQIAKSSSVSHCSIEELAMWIREAKKHIQPDPVEVRKVAIGGNLQDARELAMKMEQDSISFYESIRARMPLFEETMQDIIAQEHRHLATLRTLLV